MRTAEGSSYKWRRFAQPQGEHFILIIFAWAPGVRFRLATAQSPYYSEGEIQGILTKADRILEFSVTHPAVIFYGDHFCLGRECGRSSHGVNATHCSCNG